MKKAFLYCVVALALGAGSAFADVSTIIDKVSGDPMVAGKIMELNSQRMVVHTVAGDEATLKLDSRTLVPPDLAAGMMMKTEFKLMDNGDYYATRVIPVRDDDDIAAMTAMIDRDGVDQTASRTTVGDEGSPVAYNAGAADRVVADRNSAAYYASEAAASTPTDAERAEALKAEQTRDSEAATKPAAGETSLPQTASNQPLLALLGVVALASAGLIAFRRRRGV